MKKILTSVFLDDIKYKTRILKINRLMPKLKSDNLEYKTNFFTSNFDIRQFCFPEDTVYSTHI